MENQFNLKNIPAYDEKYLINYKQKNNKQLG